MKTLVWLVLVGCLSGTAFSQDCKPVFSKNATKLSAKLGNIYAQIDLRTGTSYVLREPTQHWNWSTEEITNAAKLEKWVRDINDDMCFKFETKKSVCVSKRTWFYQKGISEKPSTNDLLK